MNVITYQGFRTLVGQFELLFVANYMIHEEQE